MAHSAEAGSPAERERSLVAGCLTGDRTAWDDFLEGHYGTVLSVAGWKKWRFDPQEVEDVCQEIMTEIVRSLRTFKFKSNLGTFVYKVAVNTCIAQLRKKTAVKRKTLSAQVALDPIESQTDGHGAHICVNPGKSQEDLLLEQEELGSLKRALFKLEKRCKELIEARYFSDISFQEIADRTGVKTNTLVVQLKRCLVRLLGILREET